MDHCICYDSHSVPGFLQRAERRSDGCTNSDHSGYFYYSPYFSFA